MIRLYNDSFRDINNCGACKRLEIKTVVFCSFEEAFGEWVLEDSMDALFGKE